MKMPIRSSIKPEMCIRDRCKAADFIMEHYVEDVLYLGGLNDTTHKKSVKIDAVGVMYNMRTLLLAYETTKKERYLYGDVYKRQADSIAGICCSRCSCIPYGMG